MNVKTLKGLQPTTKVQKEAIVFSSDDSMNSDNSFNSSIEEDETEDYKNTIFHLKEQMSQFFLANPGLQDAIKFEDYDFNEDDGAGVKPQSNQAQVKAIMKEKREKAQAPMKAKALSDQKKPLSKADYKAFSNQWKVLGKDVIRNSQGGQTLPTLETINHRLNIFKQKVEKVDYLDILQKETQSKPEDNKQKTQQTEKSQPVRSQSENNAKQQDVEESNHEDQDIVYFSFKKKMQLALHKRQQLQKEEEEKKQKLQKDRMKKGIGMNDSMSSDSPDKGVAQKNIQSGSGDKNMEFQTHVGQMLYQTYQQTGGDKESFKKMAAIFLKNYHKKQKENLEKLKVFPPVIPKFTSDDCKHLNLLLPDFSTQLYAPNKQNLFQGAENYKFPANSPEQEFMTLVDQILEGKVMQFWKEMHITQ